MQVLLIPLIQDNVGVFNNLPGGTFKDINSRGDAIRIEDSGTLTNSGTLVLDITSGSTSDAIQNENVFVGAAGRVIEVGCPGNINEIEVNEGNLNLGNSCINFDVTGPGSGGNDFDRFEIRNTILDISAASAKLVLDPAYTPADGDCFKIVDGNSDGTGTVGGEFAAVSFVPALPPGLGFEVDYTDPTEVEVCIILAPLPVELVNFTGENTTRGSQLNWVTASELNNAHFEVEHSTDGREFTMLDKVAGNGTTQNAQSYDFLHKTPAVGENYYRLKQVDFDGAFEYSNIVYVENKNNSEPVIIYPNPAHDFVTYEGGAATLTFFDAYGRKVMEQTTQDQSTTVDVTNLEVGIYMLEITNSSNEKTVKRFLKN